LEAAQKKYGMIENKCGKNSLTGTFGSHSNFGKSISNLRFHELTFCMIDGWDIMGHEERGHLTDMNVKVCEPQVHLDICKYFFS